METNRIQNSRKIILAAALSLTVVFLFYFFVDPASAHAEKIYEVLKGTTGPSKVVKDVWTAVMTLMNYTGAAMLIFIAFANILRLDLNTYGIKKFLPSFIFAIIMANFSWILVRFVVDLASVACDALINSPRGAGVDVAKNEFGIAKAFTFKLPGSMLVDSGGTLNWSGIGSALLLTLLEFVGTVMILILAFLFVARQYFLYFIVAIGPLAFVTAVLPFTKTVWNYWWTNLWKWAFMPVVSLFWLWLGSQWIVPMTSGQTEFSVLSLLFAGVCFYMAITNPSKMGEGIMNAWKGVGKWGYKNTAGKGVDYMKAKGQANWNATKQNAQMWVREKTGLGDGLAAAKQREKDAMEYKAGRDDKAAGAYIEKAGLKRADARTRLMSMQGSTDYAEKGQLSALTKSEKYKKRLEERRSRSILGAANQEAFEANWNELNSRQLQYLHESKDSHGKKLAPGEFPKDQNGNEIVDPEILKNMKDWKQYADRELFLNGNTNAIWGAKEAEEEASKKKNDSMKTRVEARASIDNAVTEKENAEKMIKALQKLVELEEAGVTEGEEHEKASNTLRAEGYDPKDEKIAEVIGNRSKLAEENYKKIVQPLIDKANAGQRVPEHLQDMLQRDSEGKYTVPQWTGLQKSRTGKYLNGEINSGASTVVERFSAREIAHSLQHGNAAEGFSKADVQGYFRGEKHANADVQRKIAEFARAQMSLLGNNVHGTGAMAGFVDSIEAGGNVEILRDAARAVNSTYNAQSPKSTKRVIIDESIDDPNALAAQLKEVYSGEHTGLKTAYFEDYEIKPGNVGNMQVKNRLKSHGTSLVSAALSDSRILGAKGGPVNVL